MKKLYIIGGTMGVGKTAVCRQLKKMLNRSVFLDGDWCWDANPLQVTEETQNMVMDNICHMLNNFIHCSAYDNIIFCWVMHQQEIVDGLLARLDTKDCQVKTVSLVCDEKTLRERLQRDVNNGIRSADVVDRSVARLPLYQLLHTIAIDTTSKSIETVVKEILAK